jgi:outer membrane protein, heavy metal efflux system
VETSGIRIALVADIVDSSKERVSASRSGLGVLVLLFAVVGWPSPAAADDSDMRAFVQQVLNSNPTLRARRLESDSARARASAEGYWRDPELSVMVDRVPKRMDGEMPMLRYQVSQMIMWPGKLRLMEAAAMRQADGAAADVEVRRLELIREAQRAYLMLVQNRAYREVNEATRRLLETVLRTAISRYGAGSGGHHETVRAEVERSALDVEALSLEGERQSTIAMLNALRDRPADAPFDDPAAMAARQPFTATFAELMRSALARRPELKRMRAMQLEEASMAELARRERYPDLMTGVWYNQMLGGADTAGVMLGATIPVFSVPRQIRRARAYDLSAESVRSDISGMRAMVGFQVSDALRRVHTAERSLTLVTNVAKPRAEQSFSSALSAYSTGAADLVLVLDAWRALQRMELARIDADIAEQAALADLEFAIGGPAPGDLP